MRRLLIGWLVAAAVVLIPCVVWAGNQEVAEQIAANLRESGQLRGYKIGVKYQDGTAWLRGRVSSQEQMNAALRVVFQAPGVTRVVNNLSVDAADAASPVRPNATAALSIGRVQSVTPQVAAPPPAVQPLQQMAGAYGPENVLRSGSTMLRGAPAGAVGVQPAMAQRVSTTFTPAPAEPVTATTVQEPAPTLAPAQPAPQAAPPLRAQPLPVAYSQAPAAVPMPAAGAPMPVMGGPLPQYVMPVGAGVAPARYDQPQLPNYAWPSYAAYPNYAALTYPKQYSPTAWPYIGPFYPYPQVPLGWRRVCLEWHDGWWFLDFDDGSHKGPLTGLFRPHKIPR